jgi:hypothetical protein
MKDAKEHSDIAYICYDKLIVHPPSQKTGMSERAKPPGQYLQPNITHTPTDK